MKSKHVFVAVLLAFVLAFGASSAWASVWYYVQKELDLYGHIDQQGVSNPDWWEWDDPSFGSKACGPTATINSFIYLQNKYGFDLSVDPDNPDTDIHKLGQLMGMGQGGVSDVGFITGKQAWLDTYGDDKYYMVYQSDNLNLGGVIPDWWFIFSELSACEDVEVCFEWVGGTGGHCVTATSFNFDDEDGDLIIDPTENAYMDFIDPWGGVTLIGNLTMDPSDPRYLNLTYSGGGAGGGATGRIFMVAAESPIPEPATIIVWGLLLAAGFVYWRRRAA